jgi:2-phospho-L-lactate guanylyltransferase
LSSWALVPVKARSTGKQRLARVLDEAQRAALIQLMLAQALTALEGSALIDEVAVLTSDPEALPGPATRLADSGLGLNDSLQRALAQLSARGATRVTVLFADLPLVSAADVTRLVGAAAATGVALAPDHLGTGTNALTLSLPTPFRFQFGPGSCARHVLESERCGARASVLNCEGLGFDIDEPADLERLRLQHPQRFSFL